MPLLIGSEEEMMEELFKCPTCGESLVPRCFYCGERTEDSPKAVETHIMTCEKHPIRGVYRRLADAKAENKRLRYLLRRSFRGYHGDLEGRELQYVGVHVVRWGERPAQPTVGFVEWDDEAIGAALVEEATDG